MVTNIPLSIKLLVEETMKTLEESHDKAEVINTTCGQEPVDRITNTEASHY